MNLPNILSLMTNSTKYNWWKLAYYFGEGNGTPLQCSCPDNPRDWGAWWAAVYGVTQSRTRLKRLSSSSSKLFKVKKKKSLYFIDYAYEHPHCLKTKFLIQKNHYYMTSKVELKNFIPENKILI